MGVAKSKAEKIEKETTPVQEVTIVKSRLLEPIVKPFKTTGTPKKLSTKVEALATKNFIGNKKSGKLKNSGEWKNK